MKIYTSNFATSKKITDCVFISIARYRPKFWTGYNMTFLGPPTSVLNAFKESGNEITFEKDYMAYLDTNFSAERVLKELNKYGAGENVCLLCYEKSDMPCHRHTLRKWFQKNGVECEEWKQ